MFLYTFITTCVREVFRVPGCGCLLSYIWGHPGNFILSFLEKRKFAFSLIMELLSLFPLIIRVSHVQYRIFGKL